LCFLKSYLVIVVFPNAESLSEIVRVGKTEFFGERHLTQGQIQDRGWVIQNSTGFAALRRVPRTQPRSKAFCLALGENAGLVSPADDRPRFARQTLRDACRPDMKKYWTASRAESMHERMRLMWSTSFSLRLSRASWGCGVLHCETRFP